MLTKIKKYSVLICDKSGILKDDDHFKMTELDVIAENEQFIVVNDRHFTTIEKVPRKQYAIYPEVGKASIGLYNGDSCWGNRITYTLYSFAPVKASRIKKEIEKKVAEKFSFFTGRLDLSIVKDK